MNRYLCGTPKEQCSAGLVGANNGLSGNIKAHSTREEAFRCHVRHLLKQGYTRVGSREFASPNNGPVLVLAKKSHFGGVLRTGKKGEGQHKGGRYMPERGGIVY